MVQMANINDTHLGKPCHSQHKLTSSKQQADIQQADSTIACHGMQILESHTTCCSGPLCCVASLEL
jgi:hypothetical protein